MTKLFNAEFRTRILASMRPEKMLKYKIPQYARYVVDGCIVNRDKTHENDREWGYGFTPVNFLCAVMEKGGIDKKFFEFNTVSHFLREKDGDTAVEVVECILVKWAQEDRNIKDFDIDMIDYELARIEREYLAEQKAKEEKEAENADMEQSKPAGESV